MDEYMYEGNCPNMHESVCEHCAMWDPLNESCLILQNEVLTKRLSYDTIDESFNLKGGAE
jgi:hypothetical protein